MVSLRRRRLLGLCSGVRNSFLAPLPRFSDNGVATGSALCNTNLVSVHPIPSANMIKPVEVIESVAVAGLSNHSGSGSSKELRNQPSPGHEAKRRKRHRRKHINNQEQCVLRGVYFKNMKWQAAIKVDKKQIHLGTVGSQEEAAHLYDRAAFMCGREPNFELSEEEKKELQTYKWDEFLAMTRHSITKTKGRHGARSQIKPEHSIQNSGSDGDQAAEDSSSVSDDAEQDMSAP